MCIPHLVGERPGRGERCEDRDLGDSEETHLGDGGDGDESTPGTLREALALYRSLGFGSMQP